jgi:hypothetical protein
MTTTASPATATASGVTLEYPGTWFSQVNGDGGLTVAERQEDFTAERPAGARLTMEPGGVATTDASGILDKLVPSGTDPAAVAGSITVVEAPAQTQVGAEQAVSVALRDERGGQSTIARYVVVELAGGKNFLFSLEAPADQWDGKIAALEKILQSARFPTAAG